VIETCTVLLVVKGDKVKVMQKCIVLQSECVCVSVCASERHIGTESVREREKDTDLSCSTMLKSHCVCVCVGERESAKERESERRHSLHSVAGRVNAYVLV